ERIGECTLDRQLPLADGVLEEQHRGLHAEPGGQNADADLDRHRLLEIENHEDIERSGDQEYDRRDEAEEQERDVRRMTAVACHDQLFLGLLLSEPLAKVES